VEFKVHQPISARHTELDDADARKPQPPGQISSVINTVGIMRSVYGSYFHALFIRAEAEFLDDFPG
jgi:hypothetical protein